MKFYLDSIYGFNETTFCAIITRYVHQHKSFLGYKCNVVVYVGETEKSLKERFTEHLRDVRNGADEPINKHFLNHTDQDFPVAVLGKMHDDSKVDRLIHEEH